MNSEEFRLKSFDIWWNSDPMCTRMLAANGFYATGNLFEVECNWCHCRFSDWTMNENIEQRHSSLNPNCDFITNRNHCGNIPSSSTSAELLQIPESETSANDMHAPPDLLIEKDRLATFVNWPNPNITPESLAKAGFFYLDRSDEVQCAWCKGVIAQWEKQDNAFEEHQRFFPECPRVQLGPLIEIANDGIRGLGIQQMSSPKNPNYASLHARLRTYSNWPIPDIQKPEDLAQAGLYYQKVDDQVKCFHCNMGLRSWEKEDDPWFEHAKWYPMCDFVRLVKGANYIQEVQELTRRSGSMAVEEAMLTEPVKQALDMGVSADKLRYKVQQKILKTGQPYQTADDLLDDIFNEQGNLNADLENGLQISSGSCASNSGIAGIQNTSYTDPNRTDASVENVLNKATTSTSVPETILRNPHVHQNNKVKMIQTENLTPSSETKENLTSDRQYLEEENRKLKDARLCKVCLDEEVGVVYLPCGHLVTCVQCAPGVNQCPMCRTNIKGFVRTYLS